ncbi:hypothetical protein [Comamonas sp. JC664]|uniref:hypothetical protein n=1 Tax=Comamonas sp. JC664 TaxID=2801917 RepID=UPI00361D525A
MRSARTWWPLEQRLTLQPREAAQTLLHAGQGARFSARQLQPLAGNAVQRAAWQQGMLAVDDWPLADVAQALQAYFFWLYPRGPFGGGSACVWHLQAGGGELLGTLGQMLPLQIQRWGPLITIGAQGGR